TLFPLALTLHRVSAQVLAETLTGRGRDTGVDVEALWRASDIVDEHIGDEPVTPLAPRVAVRAAEHELPAGLVAALDTHLRAYAAPEHDPQPRLGGDPRGARRRPLAGGADPRDRAHRPGDRRRRGDDRRRRHDRDGAPHRPGCSRGRGALGGAARTRGGAVARA